MDTSKLHELRKDIDEVDQKLVELIKKRMDLSKKVGKLKKKEGITLELKGREKVIFDMLAQHEGKNGFREGLLADIWKLLMAEGKRIQKEIIEE